MQQDLYDAVRWAIDQKIVDPKRIAAMGWSGGGFATLCALEMRLIYSRCGVDVVGPVRSSDTLSLLSQLLVERNAALATARRRFRSR